MSVATAPPPAVARLKDAGAPAPELMRVVTAISMLHERPWSNSATRLFRGRPVLSHTLSRVRTSTLASNVVVLCWDDQRDAVIAADHTVRARSCGVRHARPLLDAITVARRWSDGWRGGVLQTCEFDRGFDAAFLLSAIDDANAVVLVDPAAALIDPRLLDQLVERAQDNPDLELCFSPAAPGLCGVLLRRALVENLRTNSGNPGRLLHYIPGHPVADPLSGVGCVTPATSVARSAARYTLDSDSAIRRVDAALERGAGNWGSVPESAEQVVEQIREPVRLLPRDLAIELTTRRSSRPQFAPTTHLPIQRPDITETLLTTLLDSIPDDSDTRITLAGCGDPLLHERLPSLLALLSLRCLPVAIETDLLELPDVVIRALVNTPPDLVLFHLPAIHPATYQRVMGVDGYSRVLANVQRLANAFAGRAAPLLVPVFTKCRDNMPEMEAWYDHWLNLAGTAVIDGASDFGGRIPTTAPADISPPKREACRRLSTRFQVWSDGSFAPCDQDVRASVPLGIVGQQSLLDSWQAELQPLRVLHNTGRWSDCELCQNCSEWHRP